MSTTQHSQIHSRVTQLFLVFLFTLTVFSTSTAAAQNTSPLTVVETMVNSVLSILRNGELTLEQSKTSIKETLFKSFDSRAMAQSVLSTNWREANTEQQNEFEALFLQTLEITYINRLEAYTDEKVDFLDEDIRNKRSTVETIIVTSSNNIPVDYKLRLRSDGWFVYDVVIESVSMVSSYRDTYRSVIRRSGMDDLLVQMRDKVEELEQ